MHLNARRAVRTLLLLGWLALLPAATGLAGEAGTAKAQQGTAPQHARRARHRSAQPGARDAQTRGQLRALQARMAQMAAQNSRDAQARGRLTGQLRTAELSLSRQRAVLVQTDETLAEQSAHRAQLAAERTQKAHELDAARAGLADEIRAAYLLDRQGPLQMLLNQKNPLASERLMAYYGYFSRAGAAQIARIGADVQQLDTLDAQLAQQQSALTSLQKLQQTQLQQLAAARGERRRVLVSLTTRVQSRVQQLSALQGQQAALERLLEQLRAQSLQQSQRRAASPASEPHDFASVFGRLRGQLDWPVQGRVTAVYGQRSGSGVAWDGTLIDTGRDSPVRAVAAGRVVYADWLPGLGLLIIVDHGAGYLSLYGHNDRLYRAVGAQVMAGEVIAAAGDTGGRPSPQLYFEIRRDGRPIDPAPWFRAHAPSP
ncbi:MAG TPA: peptidoglycan DD-metalloendopeptidase family protein [Steroidobacteraceae bacterium]|jgi:septal ring factor EnvC (AmiA/AmiB activator)|nr:peptidoglycan DD-metalloendopeptidase family protein [Steroidobacteraceae bacterium]